MFIFNTLVFSHVHISVSCVYAQSCQTLHDPVDCSPPGFSVHGVFHAKILEWVAISTSRGYSPPRARTQVSCTYCIAGGFFTTESSGKPRISVYLATQWVETSCFYLAHQACHFCPSFQGNRLEFHFLSFV